MARSKDETIYDYEARVEEMEKMRELELREAKAQGRKYRPGMSMYEMNKQDIEEQRADLERRKGTWEQSIYRNFVGAMNPTQRKAAYERAYGVSDRDRFVADNTFRESELKTREREAELKARGMEYQGARAAEFNAEAVKHKADKDLEMGKYNVDRQKEIEAARNATNENIADINAEAQVDVQKEKNKGTGIAGEWSVKTEQERAKTEAAKAAAQERVYQNRYGERRATTDNEKIANIATQLSKNKKYRKYTPEQLRDLAERMYRQRQSGE